MRTFFYMPRHTASLRVDLSWRFERIARWLCFAAVLFSLEGCATVGSVKEPTYAVGDREGDFEVRRYGPRVVAETTVTGTWSDAGNDGFRRLAGYIFGNNKQARKVAMTSPVAQRAETPEPRKLAMTAPVAQRAAGDAWIVAFTMPQGETLETLPVPDDERVLLREVQPYSVAVVRFSGRWSLDKMRERGDALRSWAVRRGLSVVGEPEVNRYDPPFMPWFMRRNEVWLQLAAPPHLEQ